MRLIENSRTDAPELLGPVFLPGRDGTYELQLVGGRVGAVRPAVGPARGLALPAFADLHVHAERAYAPGPRLPRSLVDAIELSRALRAGASVEQIFARETAFLDRALGHGSLTVRSHVDVDSVVEERALRAAIAARAAFAGRLQLELVAFATALCDPVSPDGERRLTAAAQLGADLLGAVPAFYPDPGASIERMLDLGRSLGLPIDLHVDETTDPGVFWLERLAEATLERGLEGRVTASHCCSLASVTSDLARRTITTVAAAGITVVALPATNLFMQGRGGSAPGGRGITLIGDLVEAGVPVRFGSDNVRDVFYPYGDCDPLEAAFLAAIGAHVDDEDVLLAGICGGRTRIEPGDPADLVVLDASSLREAIARRPGARTVLRAGRVVSSVQRSLPKD